MATYYLKATDEQALWEAMETAGLAYKDYDPDDPLNHEPADWPIDGPAWEPTGSYTWRSTTTMFDQIGTIYGETGNVLTDSNGLPYPEMAPIDDFYYANLRDEVDIPKLTADQVAALPTIAAPADPYRIWAGDK
jgi:hypothetical protein